MDDEYRTYNINADDAACAIAKAMKVEKLAFLTDIEGVYADYNDKSTLFSELRISKSMLIRVCTSNLTNLLVPITRPRL